MTKKEYNSMRTALYTAAMEIEEVREAVETTGGAFVYEIYQLPDLHKFVVLTRKAQLNENTLRENGFDPVMATCKLKLKLNR